MFLFLQGGIFVLSASIFFYKRKRCWTGNCEGRADEACQFSAISSQIRCRTVNTIVVYKMLCEMNLFSRQPSLTLFDLHTGIDMGKQSQFDLSACCETSQSLNANQLADG